MISEKNKRIQNINIEIERLQERKRDIRRIFVNNENDTLLKKLNSSNKILI